MNLKIGYRCYLIKVCKSDPKFITMDFALTYEVFARSLLDASRVGPDQGSVPFPHTSENLIRG